MLCSAIIDGKFQEVVWIAGEEVFKVSAKMQIDGKWHKWNIRRGFKPFSRARKEEISYSPYCARAGDGEIGL